MLDEPLTTGALTVEAVGLVAESWAPEQASVRTPRPRVLGVARQISNTVRKPSLVVSQRRHEPRYQTVENRIWMQWWQGDEYIGRAARLVNVSRSGAMLVSWHLLQKEQVLRIFLEEPAPQIGVGAVVLGVVEGIKSMHQVRIGFSAPCPDVFFEAATSGFESWLAGKRTRS